MTNFREGKENTRKTINYIFGPRSKLTILSTKCILATFTSAIDGTSNTTLYIKTAMSELAQNNNQNTRMNHKAKDLIAFTIFL